MRRLLALLVLLGLPALAQPANYHLYLNTDPPAERILLQNRPGQALQRQPEGYFLLPAQKGNLRLTCQLDGHQDFPLTIPWETFTNEPDIRYPAPGQPLPALAPLNFGVAVQDRLSAHPWLAGVASLALLGALLTSVRTAVEGRRRGARLARLEALRVNQSDNVVGSRLGRWRVVSRLGAGGMATVYRAVPERNLNEAEAVAIKLMHPHHALDQELLLRYQREIDISKNLVHPNLVRVLDADEHDGVYYLVMELVDGDSLRQSVRPEGMTPAEAWVYLQPLMEGLTYAHQRQMVHRDLKPENIMLNRQGKLKIMDFGLARRRHVDATVTPSGNVMGTPAYIAPEQISAGGLDPRSDQYSLGVIAYELLRGHRPFDSDEDQDPMRVLMRHLTEPPPGLTGVKPEVAAVVLKMLPKDPTERYGSVAEVARAWQAAVD